MGAADELAGLPVDPVGFVDVGAAVVGAEVDPVAALATVGAVGAVVEGSDSKSYDMDEAPWSEWC